MKIFKTTLFLLIFAFFLSTNSYADETLQSRIDQASKGEIIEIEEGIYEESLTLKKSIKLIGKGDVVIRSCEEKPVITIGGKNNTLENIKVEHCSKVEKTTAIYVTGSGHMLQDIQIDAEQFGIKLDKANHITITDSYILGHRKGNGIDLWESTSNTIQNMNISRFLDGIYMEQSNRNLLRENTLTSSRYGMHLMYANDNILQKNSSRKNLTGTMLMEAKRTSVLDNDFSLNLDNVNAQGLLMYYVTDSKIIGNHMTENRVGIYMEDSQNNTIKSNKLTNNYIGVQFKRANDNQIILNTFAGNVNEAQAIESSKNTFMKNYWEASAKIDTSGKGISVVPFTADPYFLTLTEDLPEYQLFFQAPGLSLLQKMLKSSENQLLIDSSPLMKPSVEIEKDDSSGSILWTISIVMLCVSLLLFVFGRKRI